jgi:putative variant cofactor biosynthesis B12-binding/radical SAM domain protein 1
MRILLIQVPTSHLGAGERVYPLGLSRLSGTISGAAETAVLDMNLSIDPWPQLKEVVQQVAPHLVALSFRNLDPLAGHHSSYLSSLKTAARLVRHLAPQARIFAGGPAFSLFAHRLMAEIPELDGGIMGEGEMVFRKLVLDVDAPAAVPGLVWRKGDAIFCNQPAKAIAMDGLPQLDTSAFNPRDYLVGNRYIAAVGIEGKRGCDLCCSYCVYPCLGGGRMRLRTPEKIVDEIEWLHREFGADLFHFTDAVVNRPPDHFEALCREILKRKLCVSWTGFFREDHLTRPHADLAVQAGLIAIYFSGDALTDHGLAILRKRLTRQDLIQAARVAADTGVLTMNHFLMNLPGDDAPKLQLAYETLDTILDIHAPAGNLGAVIFNTVRLYPGAPLTQKLFKEGLIDPHADLLYPTYFNPPATAHWLHELEAHCHSAGVFSRLDLVSKPSAQREAGSIPLAVQGVQ